MISLDRAKDNNFATSTRAELRKYAEELGLDNVPPNADSAKLKRLICNALGIAQTHEGSAAPTPKATMTRGGDTIFPSYNLTPNGLWGGRRHRLSIPRPDGVKDGQAELFFWSSKYPYSLTYDEVDSVPEPIYNIIATNRRRRPKMVRPENGQVGEITTVWEFDQNPFNYFGIDEDTKDRAGSLLEWYRSRGTEWFKDKTDRQLTQIAQKLEVQTTAWAGDGLPRRLLSGEELRDRIIEFLFGFADAEAEPDERIAA